MELFEQTCYKICRGHLLLFGIWPHQRQLTAILARTFILSLCAHNFISELCSMIKSRNNIYVIIERMPFFLTAYAIIVLYVYHYIKMEMFKEMLDRIQYDWQCAAMNQEVHILAACMKDGWKRTLYYIVSLYLVSTAHGLTYVALAFLENLTPLNTTIAVVPALQGSFFDHSKKLSLIVLYRFMSGAAQCIVMITMSLQYNILYSHACGIFTIFGNRLEHAFHDNSGKLIKHNRAHMNLARTVQQHDQILQYVSTINSYYYVFHSIVASFAVLVISSLLVNIDTSRKNHESYCGFVLYVAYFYGITSNLFFIAITGQELIDVSSNVFRQMYCGKWSDASISNQKTLLVIMCKCMRPAAVSFASLFTVSSETCATVLKASMSYFTVLCSLQ